MSIRNQLLFFVLLLPLILAVFQFSHIDEQIQAYFYDGAAVEKPPIERWVIPKTDPVWEFWLHKVAKQFTVITGSVVLLLGVAGFWVRPLAANRGRFIFLACSLGLVGLLVGGAKQFTNIYCPNQLTLYGGDKPHVHLFESYPSDFQNAKKGKCFPAGHSTAGFGFMALYFYFAHRNARRAGLAFGVAFGWTLGTFQMLRGEHFLSHTITAMITSWMVILLIVAAFQKLRIAIPPDGSKANS